MMRKQYPFITCVLRSAIISNRELGLGYGSGGFDRAGRIAVQMRMASLGHDGFLSDTTANLCAYRTAPDLDQDDVRSRLP